MLALFDFETVLTILLVFVENKTPQIFEVPISIPNKFIKSPQQVADFKSRRVIMSC